MQKNFRSFSAVIALLFIVTGCSRSAPVPSPSDSSKPRTYVVGVSLTRIDEPWRAQLKEDIEAAAAKHPDIQLVVKVAENDVATQIAQLNEFHSAGVNAVIIRPVEAAALTEPAAQLVAAGTPVVVVERALIGDKYTCFIAPDFKQIGTKAGKWLAEKLGGKGNLFEIRGPVDSLSDQELHGGFRSAFLDPGYRLTDAHVDPPRTDAAKLMSEAIAGDKKIDALFAFDDASAHAAYETAKAADRADGTLFVGVGGVPSEGAAYVADGTLAASFLLPTGGAEAVDAVAKLLHNDKVPKRITPETRIITK